MKSPRSVSARGIRDDRWVEALLEGQRTIVHAPSGFARKVMDSVYRESLAGRPSPTAAVGRSAVLAAAVRMSRPAARMYRRLGLSLMLTAAVLAASLLIPHGAYSTLIGSGADAALGAGPSAAVQNVLAGAGHAVQGALGEQQIGGYQE